ncbi:hypothetical protein FQZ97_942960 [compost metagenome]
MQDHQTDHDELAHVLVVARRQGHCVAGDEAHERAEEGDLVVAHQSRAHLRQEDGQQHKHRQCAQGRVTHPVLGLCLPAQVGNDRRWCKQETAEARPVSAHETPDHAEQQKCQHRVAQAHVPVHPVAADVRGDHKAHDGGGEQPVEQAGGQVPDANGLHG